MNMKIRAQNKKKKIMEDRDYKGKRKMSKKKTMINCPQKEREYIETRTESYLGAQGIKMIAEPKTLIET